MEEEQKEAKPKKKPRGRPFTTESARACKHLADAAKARRKQVRAEMLETLCTKANLGEELFAAMKAGDEKRMNAIEKAIRIVGLHFDQGEEAIQRLDVKSDNKVDTKLQINVTGLD